MIRGLLTFVALAVTMVGGLYLLDFYRAHRGGLPHADFVVVEKSKRRMVLMRGGRELRSYSVSLGANPEGHKQQEGDERTPEGRYVLDRRNARSSFYKAIHISYPNGSDRKAARQRGVSPGGNILIHGLPNGWSWAGPFIRLVDWTDGCIAVNNGEMDQIWKAVPNGTPIEIKP